MCVGGRNPELQVTDHGSDTACMHASKQTGRGRKRKIHWLWIRGEERGERSAAHTFLKVDDTKCEAESCTFIRSARK